MVHALSVAICAVFVACLGCASPETRGPYAQELGGPLPGLSSAQLAQFKRGQAVFARLFTPQTGLGPLFNDNSCRACHNRGASGGHAERASTLVGAMYRGGPSLLEHLGGPMIQERAITGTELEKIPGEATSLSQRLSPPVWGVGLVEAIPAEAILAQMRPDLTRRGLGIRGIANWERGRIGRFGMKAQKATLQTMTSQAFSWQMGIATPNQPEEPLPNRSPNRMPRGEISQATVDDLVAYQRFLGAPPRGPIDSRVRAGERAFARVGCVHCHTPALRTGPNEFGIPAKIQVPAYSDFLVHMMDESLADQMVQGAATGQMWRTTPLWGLRLRERFLHDGRATTLHDTISLHGGEAQGVVAAYSALSTPEKAAIEAFLRSL